MAVSVDENLNFVILLEEHKDAIEKSQVPSAKKKKEEALSIFIDKWSKMCGKELTQAAILKKVNNLKTRAKAAINKGAPLTTWQTKVLELTKVVFSLHSSNFMKRISTPDIS